MKLILLMITCLSLTHATIDTSAAPLSSSNGNEGYFQVLSKLPDQFKGWFRFNSNALNRNDLNKVIGSLGNSRVAALPTPVLIYYESGSSALASTVIQVPNARECATMTRDPNGNPLGIMDLRSLTSSNPTVPTVTTTKEEEVQPTQRIELPMPTAKPAPAPRQKPLPTSIEVSSVTTTSSVVQTTVKQVIVPTVTSNRTPEATSNAPVSSSKDDLDDSQPPGISTKLDRSLMLKLLNDVRAQNGAPPVQLNDKLNEAAQKHSYDQWEHEEMSHTGSDGSLLGDRVNRVDFKWASIAENVITGSESEKDAMSGWIGSKDHFENMINKDYTLVGFGRKGRFWTQNFARPGY